MLMWLYVKTKIKKILQYLKMSSYNICRLTLGFNYKAFATVTFLVKNLVASFAKKFNLVMV